MKPRSEEIKEELLAKQDRIGWSCTKRYIAEENIKSAIYETKQKVWKILFTHLNKEQLDKIREEIEKL